MKGNFKILIPGIISGLISAIAQPLVISAVSEKPLIEPFYAGFFAWISFVPLMMGIRHLEPKNAFWAGFTGGTVYFAIVLYWLDIAMTVFGNMPQYFAIPVLFILVFYCALYWAVWAYITARIKRTLGMDISIFAPVVFVSLEYLRNYFLSGFPWGNIAYSQYKNLSFIQIAAIGGVYLVQYVVLLINAVIERWITYILNRKEKRPLRHSIVLLLVLLSVYIYGLIRANSVNNNLKNAPQIKVALLQGNIDQSIKQRSSEYRGSILSNYLDLIEKAKDTDPDIVIWPEAAFPQTLPDEIDSFSVPYKLLGSDNLPFLQIIGVSTYFYEDGRRILYNGAFLLDKDLRIRGKYYKSHLVPFGEYVPLGIPVEKFVAGVGTFMPGKIVRPVAIKENNIEIKAGILICYEGIFPEISREHSKNGANLLLNLTNDAWYGVSSAPYQHLSMYVFRAIENEKYLARVANTGVTSIINPYGKILSQTDIFKRTVLNGEISLIENNSFYTEIGDLFAIICSIISVLVLIITVVVFQKRR